MRIHNSLTATREAFVLALLMQTPDLNVQSVNDALADENHKDLWLSKPDGTCKPLTMAFKRIEEIRAHAKKANEDVKNGMPMPPLPPSTLKKAKAPKLEVVAEAPKDNNTVVTTSEVPSDNEMDWMKHAQESSVTNDNASDTADVAAAAAN